jgi:serine/threonine protein kinase
MGVVYEAFDEERKAPVALKTLNRAGGTALARFKREFRALQGLAHPNLVALDQLFFEDDAWFFTMELLGGVDFVSHVRGTAPRVAYASTIRESVGKLAARAAVEGEGDGGASLPFDEPRLRDGLRQLLEGLAVLHAADKVHRDVKPSNVLVARDGRVVLLDFGLVTEPTADDRSSGLGIVGTPAYMAPEQAASHDVGPAADLYAVGVMLYEAMTGHLPLEGPPLQILLGKQTSSPSPPASVVSGVPADLNALCVELLSVDPVQRPSAEEVLRRLSAPRPSGGPSRASTESSTFVGRAAELDALRSAYQKCTKGELATVLVCGESGIGKSSMVRRFAGQLLADHPEALLLEGRCYEREAVPYKALDGIADALSRRLARLSDAGAAALLPVRSAILGQVFPVMLRVPQIAREHASLSTEIEPHELRQRAFLALRALLERIAVRRPLVVAIDDLQWADEDGLRALAEILRPPDPPPLLWIGTARTSPGRESPVIERLRAVLPGDVRVLVLEGLRIEEARELAFALMNRMDRRDADPDRIATEGRGHPLFVEELARHVALGRPAQKEVKLDDAIWARIETLDQRTREMAELIAIAGKPVPQEVVAEAARVEPGEFPRRCAVLRASNIVRTGGARWADAIEPYHDRVREAVLARLGPERRRALHEALAVAIEASSHGDAETLAAHWIEAGDRSRAARYVAAAGDQAAKAFAFDRAIDWYSQALELEGPTGIARSALRIKLGEALANAGRGALAATHFEQAAVEVPSIEATDLRRRAAEQLLYSGRFESGVARLRSVFTALGLHFPGSTLVAMFGFLFFRLVLRLRGHSFRQKDGQPISPRMALRIDALRTGCHGLLMVDPAYAAYFQTRCLLLALKAGDGARILRPLALEAANAASEGTRTRVESERLVASARQLAETLGTGEATAMAHLAAGMRHYFLGEWRAACDTASTAEGLFLDRCIGVPFELSTARIMRYRTLAFTGALSRLKAESSPVLRDAEARGDRYTIAMLRTAALAFTELAADHPDAMREMLEEVRTWLPASGFTIQHYYLFIAEMQVDLYCGEGGKAFARTKAIWPGLRKSFLLRVQMIRCYTMAYRARAALSAANADPEHRSALIESAERDVVLLRREQQPASGAEALLLCASIAAHEGDAERARTRYEEAAGAFDSMSMRLHAACCRRRAGELRGGAEGERIVAEADRTLRSEEVRDPVKFARILAPPIG